MMFRAGLINPQVILHKLEVTYDFLNKHFLFFWFLLMGSTQSTESKVFLYGVAELAAVENVEGNEGKVEEIFLQLSVRVIGDL